MLIEKIQSCTSSINELSTLRSNALSVGAFEGAVNKLSTVDSMIADFVSTVEGMNKTEFCRTKFSAEDIEMLRDAIVTCATLVNQMNLTQKDVTTLTSVFQAKKSMLTLLWQSAAKTQAEPLQSYLGVIQSFAGNKDEVSNLIKALGSGASAEPNAAIIGTLTANIEKANTIANSFQMSTGVQFFCRKLRMAKQHFPI